MTATKSRKVKVAPKKATTKAKAKPSLKGTIADTGNVSAKAKKVTATTAKPTSTKPSFNRPIVTPSSRTVLRDLWLSIMENTGQINISKGGLVTKASTPPSADMLSLAWKLLAVPYHVDNARYTRTGGITDIGITFLNKGKVRVDEIKKFSRLLNQKSVPAEYRKVEL